MHLYTDNNRAMTVLLFLDKQHKPYLAPSDDWTDADEQERVTASK
jgi:hypothetical protein